MSQVCIQGCLQPTQAALQLYILGLVSLYVCIAQVKARQERRVQAQIKEAPLGMRLSMSDASSTSNLCWASPSVASDSITFQHLTILIVSLKGQE